jgi:hypothetical protein
MKRVFVVSIASALLLFTVALPLAAQERHEIAFPDLPGYETLICDFHSHTVFSDGQVWPTVRVDEAWRLGFDATAITDHIEYQPHKADLPTDHNRSHELAAGQARQAGILFPKAAEITRETPPGHFNAIFLKDTIPLDTDDLSEVFKRANEQGAFVFWNHHAWKGEERGAWGDLHTTAYDNQWLHGMEVCNGDEYYPTAHKWCLEKGLTMLGNSDIHTPDINDRTTPDKHRTVNLVFVKERTLDGLKEALMAGRTAVWFEKQMIGRPEWLEPLLEASVDIAAPHYRGKDYVLVKVRNKSDIELQLERTGSIGPETATLPPQSTSMVKIGTGHPEGPIELVYRVTNYLVAPGEGLEVSVTVGK